MGANYDSLTLMSWNINGWNDRNKQTRTDVIVGLNADVVCVIETHLLKKDSLEVDGYKTYLHNRIEHHVRTKKGYGGTAFLVKTELFEHYNVDIIDKEYDGIFVLRFRNNALLMKVYITFLSKENNLESSKLQNKTTPCSGVYK